MYWAPPLPPTLVTWRVTVGHLPHQYGDLLQTYRGLSAVINMTCLSSPVILFIVHVSYLHWSPLTWSTEKSIVCQWRVSWELQVKMIFQQASSFCRTISYTLLGAHVLHDRMIYPGFVGYFLQNWEDDCDLEMMRFGWLDCWRSVVS